MAQVQVIDIIQAVAQVCQACPTTVLVRAYIEAAREFCAGSRWLKATIAGSTIAPVITPYTTGTVTVTNGSANVVGAGTTWLTQLAAGDVFTGPNGVAYTVLNVTTDTALALTAVYGGPTLAGQAYSVARNRYTRLYSLGSDTYNEIIGISAIDITESADKINGLTEAKSSEWDQTDAAELPEWYQYVPEGQFVVHPKPNAAYPLSVGVILQPKLTANSLDDSLLVQWKKALDGGALAYLLTLPGYKWTSGVQAEKYRLLFKADIASADMAQQSGYNAGALATNRNGPRSARTRSKILAI